MAESSPQTNAPAAWIGWRRRNEPRARWQAVVEAATEAEAFRKLLDHAGQDGVVHGESVVLRAGEKP
jgi:hypothetical protein